MPDTAGPRLKSKAQYDAIASGRWHSVQEYLHDNASNTIHGPFDMTFNRIPIRSPLSEFINFFGGKDTLIPVRVRDDGSELFGAHVLSFFIQWSTAVDEVDL